MPCFIVLKSEWPGFTCSGFARRKNDGMREAHLGERRCVIRVVHFPPFVYFFVPWRLNCLQERRLVNTRRQLRVSRPYAWPSRRMQSFLLSPLQLAEWHEPPHSLYYRLKRPREAAPKLTLAENMAFANQHNTMKYVGARAVWRKEQSAPLQVYKYHHCPNFLRLKPGEKNYKRWYAGLHFQFSLSLVTFRKQNVNDDNGTEGLSRLLPHKATRSNFPAF